MWGRSDLHLSYGLQRIGEVGKSLAARRRQLTI